MTISDKFFARIGNTRHTCVGHYRTGLTLQQSCDDILAPLIATELMIAHHRLAYTEVCKQFLRYSCILCRNKIYFSEGFYGSWRHIRQITYRCADDV